MAGGKAVIQITPLVGEPYQFTFSASQSKPVQGAFAVAWFWEIARPDGQAYARNLETFSTEIDYVTTYEYTVKLTVLFSDGSIDIAMSKFSVPHN